MNFSSRSALGSSSPAASSVPSPHRHPHQQHFPPPSQQRLSLQASPSSLAAVGVIPVGVELEDGTGTAWQQNRCLLCLLYEEKLRVQQRVNAELQKKLDWLTDHNKSSSPSGDNQDKKKQQQFHVTHSTVIPTNIHRFIDIVAEKDTAMAQREKDLEHLAIDRDNLRHALDDTQEQLELLKRRIRQLDKANARRVRIRARKSLPAEESGSDPEGEAEEKRNRMEAQTKKKKNAREQQQQLHKNDKHQENNNAAATNHGDEDDDAVDDEDEENYDYLGLGLSVASVAAARRARNAAAVKLGPNERLRPIHTEGALGILNNLTPASLLLSTKTAASPAPTLSGVSPFPHQSHRANSNISFGSLLDGGAGARASSNAGWSLRDYEHLGPHNSSSRPHHQHQQHQQRRSGNINFDGKLTRDLANDELGMVGDMERLPPSPSAVDRLRPLPASDSLRSMTLAEPSR